MVKVVIIDVGHGGSDPGAVANGIIEKEANLTTALALRSFLESKGIKVFINRTSDVFLSLEYRVNVANNIAAQYPNAKIVFVSLHHNAGGGDRGEYIHSIFRGEGLKLASSIADEMEKQLGQQKKVYEKAGAGNKDYYYVIRNTKMDAVIVEVCFLDNANDVKIADTKEEQARNGRVIGAGILNYFGGEKVPIISNPPINLKPNLPSAAYYRAFVEGKWLPEVKNVTDYAGILGKQITALQIKTDTGTVTYRTSNVNSEYYPYVVNYNDYAGDMKNAIERLQIKELHIRYRVHILGGGWLPWMVGASCEDKTCSCNDDFAGVKGKKIDAFQVEVVNLTTNPPQPPKITI